MTNTVAQETSIAVAGIFQWNKAVLLAIGHCLCMAFFKEWTNDILLTRQHPYHPPQSAAAQPVQQQRFYLVVGMVRHSDRLSMSNLAQKAVAGSAGRVLQ